MREPTILLRSITVVVCASFLCLTAVSCGGSGKSTPSLQEAATRQYNENLAKWRSVAPPKYKLQVSDVSVFSSILTKTTVVNGQVVEQSVVDKQGEVDTAAAAAYIESSGTVERLFASAKSRIDQSASTGFDTEPYITYDKQYSFPSTIRNLSDPKLADGGGGRSVYTFEVIP